MSVTLLGTLLLGVSLISVVIYMTALGQLLIHERQPGMLRTAICRLFAALLYVGVGLLTVVTNEKGPLIGLAVFTIVQLIWQANSVADVRLARRFRRTAVTDPLTMPEFPDPIPNYSPPLSDFVAAAEIDKLFTKVTELRRDFDEHHEGAQKRRDRQTYWQALSVFATVLGVCGLVFGLVTYSRADRADELSHQNTQIIAENRRLIDEMRTTQTLLAKSVAESCVLYGQLLRAYNPRSRAIFPGGGTAYDAEFRQLYRSSENLDCGLARPQDLPR